MSRTDRLTGLLGLAHKAGHLVPGAEMGLKLIGEGKAGLALLDGEAGANTQKKVRDACNHYQVQVMLIDAGILGTACGRPGMAAAAMKPGGLADQVILMCNQGKEQASTDSQVQ